MLGVVLSTREARATTEIGGLDARSMALAGTGVSYIESGASVALNPATLDGVRTFAGTFTISPLRAVLTTPLDGPNTSVDSAGKVYPVFLVGAAYRLTDRIVVGAGVFPTIGSGAKYSDTTDHEEVRATLAQIEVAPSVSVRVADGLSVGLGYRMTYTTQTGHQPAAPGQPSTDYSYDGWNWLGVHAGIYYRPIESLHFGFSYRSRIDTTLSGTTDAHFPTGAMDTESEFNSPHRFKLGASYTPSKKVLLALSLRYSLYSDSSKSIKTTVQTPFGPVESVYPLDWNNALGAGAGVEVTPERRIALRAGYSATQSAVPSSRPSFFATPPGWLHSIHLGAGLRFERVDLDLGALYSLASAHIDANRDNPSVTPGDYQLHAMILSFSVTYHR
ncbi:outer membrane protein transport protein [Pendulispora brunnea]|uniref:Outer membrane protein transport protein n=1 Tax=Pendulispora brunnea TaxID=2905690 RepID=A0ABZ2KAZ3_9BACT